MYLLNKNITGIIVLMGQMHLSGSNKRNQETQMMSEIGDKGKENEWDDEGSASGDSSEVRDHRFSAPTASSSNTDEAIGKEIGPYKILSVLGEGGCGIVYLAQQGRPIKRRVALKIIKPGMDTKRVIARFEAERQALALLDHPNIARIFDAGLTSEGRPYFVMEHVRGVPITEHCDHHRLNIEQRINLFLLICDAIHYAHQKGIIHRDIKPSNILVGIHGSQSVPKVIDFGVAKAVSQPLTDKTLFTEYGQMIGTPEYMSPEQAEMTNEDIDTRTDIYSLGVIFYELLTSSLPFDTRLLRGHGIDHIRKVIIEEDPKTPSTKLRVFSDDERKIIVKGRDTEFRTLSRSIRGDLDWITIKAMEKDRIRRYETVTDLALDLKRHLKNEPVTAGPPSLKYRTGKFLRRHRTAAIMASIFTLAIVFGITMLIKASADKRKAIQVEHLRNKIQWARTEVIPTIMERIEAENYCKAYDLATDVSKWIPDDQILKGLWSKMSNSDFSLDTVPSNAKIFYREYSDVGGTWHFLGLSPISNTRFPYGCYRLRVQKEGFNATERILLNTTEPKYYSKLSNSIVLHANNEIPTGMVYVPNILAHSPNFWMLGGGKTQMGHYFIDKNEVTNKDELTLE